MRNWSLIAERLERDGELLPVAKAARLVPAHSGRLGYASASALVRWIIVGKNGIQLDGLKVGRGWVTTKSAIVRFLIACSEADAGKPQMTTPAELNDQQRRAELAKARLREMGVKC